MDTKTKAFMPEEDPGREETDMEDKEYKMHPQLHCHSKDLFDSDNDPDAFCKRLKQLGCPGFALTQHGVLSEIEPMRKAAKKYGLKFIPGIETYFGEEDDLMQNRHLILIAKDYQGYQAIWMAVSDSQNKKGYSVMDAGILDRYFGPGSKGHGHVIATSACVQGVIASVIRSNETVEKEIGKLERRCPDWDMPADTSADKAEKEAAAKEAQAKTEYDNLKTWSSMRFAKREKMIAKMQKGGDPSFAGMKAELDADKAKAKDAANRLPSAKAAWMAAKREHSAALQMVKALHQAEEKREETKEKIKALESRRMTEEEIRKKAEGETLKFQEIFGKGYFFMEIQYHGIGLEKKVYPQLVAVAEKLHIPLTAANDIHTIDNSPRELRKRQTIKAMRFEQWEDLQEGDDQLYIKTDGEMHEMLARLYPEEIIRKAAANVDRIFDACDVVFPKEEHYPKYKPDREEDRGKTANEILKEEIEKGIRWRYPEGMDAEHKERLEHEYQVITSMGYADYHLIVKDFLEYGRALSPVPAKKIAEMPYSIEGVKETCRKNNWKAGFRIGPGRGSAVGSLVCYLLGITNLDPIEYGLLFERFLNPERVSMPDIDSDIANAIREKVIGYVRHKYGEHAVCGIMTMNAQAPKGCLRIAAKYYGMESAGNGRLFLGLADRMAKSIPEGVKVAFDTKTDSGVTVYEMMKQKYAHDKDAVEILDWAYDLEGIYTAPGAHAAGMIISDNDEVKEYVPLRWNEKLHEYTTQTDMIESEAKGLLKMDMLGLTTLDIITDCLMLIERRTGKVIDPLRDIPVDDAGVYEKIFQKGATNAVFQFESDGMKTMLRKFRPDKFTDLVLLNAMFRPGPLQYLDDVIAVKNGSKPLEYLTPELEPILKSTYGAIAYQEQVMAIFQRLAGYSLGGADLVRRAMSKKHLDQIEAERQAFIHGDKARGIKGCVANGIDADAANKLFDQMTAFASYAFNKSHAAAYSTNAYYTAWLKLHYPAEFLASAMNQARKTARKKNPIRDLMMEARHMGITVRVPDVNRSSDKFDVNENGEILFGLAMVPGVAGTAQDIVKEREANGRFLSIGDFILRTRPNKTALENLTDAGAFDSFCPNREAVSALAARLKKELPKVQKKQAQADIWNRAKAARDGLAAMPFDDDLAGYVDMEEDKFLPRYENAASALAEAEDAFIREEPDLSLPEDGLGKMNRERELLGVYVSAHPMAGYDRPEGVTAIGDMCIGTTRIMGVVSAVETRSRKKDGKPMAFLTIEDTTGEARCAVFTSAYNDNRACLEEGTVVTAQGKAVTDGEGEGQTLLFSISRMRRAEKEKSVYTKAVSLYALFHLREEDAFREQYESEDGHPFRIYDETCDQFRKVSYRVSEQALLDGAVTE